MARTKLNQSIYDLEGNTTTLAKLLDEHKAKLNKLDNWVGRKGKKRIAYFVDLLEDNGTVGGSFEIGKMAYESRMQKQIQEYGDIPAAVEIVKRLDYEPKESLNAFATEDLETTLKIQKNLALHYKGVRGHSEDRERIKTRIDAITQELRTRQEQGAQDSMNTQEIYNRLVELKEQDESSDIEKAELLATVKNGKLYKESHGTFARFADAIGYHRTYCYDLIRVWQCESVREAYSEIGAFAATKIAKANLSDDQTRELVEFAKSHKSKEITARIREIKNKGQEPQSKADRVIELLAKKDNLEKQLNEVIAKIERLTGKTSKAKTRKRNKTSKPAVGKLGDIESILKPFSAKRSTLLILQAAYFQGNKVSTTDLESYATLEVEGLNVTGCFAMSEFKTLKKVPLNALFITNEDRLDVTSESGSQSIPLLPDPEQEYPLPPHGELVNKTVTLSLDAWELLVSTVHAAEKDPQSRPILHGVYLHTVNGQLTAAAADGFVLAVNPLGVEVEEEWSADIPSSQLVKVAKAVKKLKAQKVSITTYRHESTNMEGKQTTYPHVTFEAEGKGAKLTVQTQLIEGKFPDYEQIIPRANEKVIKVVVDKTELMDLNKKVSDANPFKVVAIGTYTINGRVKAEAPDDRGSWEIPTIRSDGKEVTLAYNPRLFNQLLAAMPNVDSLVIAIPVHKEDSFGRWSPPAYIMATENGSEAAIMPMNLER